ncbi:MAG TPA: PAS domain S-box protein [Ramlibacter sp.]|jgi:PAS domain S-box-containing protein|uniref:hybrid sensor histidine kinase/response regulator n=1 Tax=Ramlibacter sp. TaxID=1917967 RepID=UPI002D3EF950|nr:PAS domain S-box protein [Ramlibacter sp.]HZY19853.1 PAS domain S-box protein [Ramlibacter sp.]
MSSSSYLVSTLPQHELAELHRLMNEEVEEVAVFFMDPDGIITVWNRAAEEMKGFTAQDAIGQHLRLLYTEEDRARHWAEHNLGEALKHGFYREETWRRRKDGSRFWARIALTALHDSSGRLLGFSKITMDLTDHKQLERCLREREQTRRVLRAANAGMWTWHPQAQQVEVSENFLRLLGQDGGDSRMPLAQWLAFLHPDDRPKLETRFEAALRHGAREPFSLELRMTRRTGGHRWFHVHAEWHRETPQGPFELSGVNVDIDELKRAEARKDEFLAMLAHELRNPLAPIRSAAEVLRVVKLDEQRVRKTSEVIARQADHMTSLVDDLLDVSRVTRGLVQLASEPVDVAQVVAEAVEQLTPVIRARQHHLTVRQSPRVASVLGDHKRLVQVVANLLSNAAKFTAEGGNLLVRTEVHAEGGSVVVSVSDDGIGMEPALAARAFELFAQAERTPDRSAGGLGLGLALVKSLVELQGGTVTCTSDGLGRGSTFSITLPLAAPQDRHAAEKEDAQRRTPRRLRAMVVDDNEDAAVMLALLLEGWGYDVAVEHDSRAALARAEKAPPEVFVLDIGLPVMDGNELARQLRARPATAGAVLIALTGYGQDRDRELALAAGFDHHLVKPVNPDKLGTLLAEVAAGRGAG